MEGVFGWHDLLDWARTVLDPVWSRAALVIIAAQIGAIAAAFLAAWSLSAATRAWRVRLCERLRGNFLAAPLLSGRSGLATLAFAWLLLVVVGRTARHYDMPLALVGIAASLTALWFVLRASTLLLRDSLVARFVATIAWIVVALDVLGLLGPVSAALDSIAVTLGTVRLSLLLVLKAVAILAVLLWAALALAGLIGTRLRQASGISPSVQALAGNLLKIVLLSIALLIGFNIVGIDLTAFAVLSGAIGVGIGLGLQKIVSNFFAGVILLVEQSIKPGDVIEVAGTYGWITALNARHVSVRGRDGKHYLIPNDTLITNQVTNWSYASPLIRLDVAFGVGYDSDLRQVRALAIEAAQTVNRVLSTPPPVCHVTAFGDNAVNMLLRFWIEDPSNGVTNVRGDVFLALWDVLQQHKIELPCPQREIRIRELPDALLRAAAFRDAAE